jgi:hypothetical protein
MVLRDSIAQKMATAGLRLSPIQCIWKRIVGPNATRMLSMLRPTLRLEKNPAAEGRGHVAYPTCCTRINGVDLAVHAAVRNYDYLLEMIDFQS